MYVDVIAIAVLQSYTKALGRHAITEALGDRIVWPRPHHRGSQVFAPPLSFQSRRSCSAGTGVAAPRGLSR